MCPCRVELCSFSGYKIYPGHGRRYARTDGKVSAAPGSAHSGGHGPKNNINNLQNNLKKWS